jgi:hypothetical protein
MENTSMSKITEFHEDSYFPAFFPLRLGFAKQSLSVKYPLAVIFGTPPEIPETVFEGLGKKYHRPEAI